MSLILALKVIHVIAAVVAVGANVTYALWLNRAKHDPAHLTFALRGIRSLDTFVANPAYVVLGVTGPAMVLAGAFSFTQGWIIVSLVLYVVVAVLGIAGVVVGYALEAGPLEDFPQIANPYGVDAPIVRLVGVAGSIVAAGSMVASAVSLIVRLRHAGSEKGQQIKWLAYGGAVAVGTLCVSLLINLWNGPVGIVVSNVALLGLPVFTGIAIVKHHLYDIDLLINRTLVYGSLTTMLVAVYVSGIVLSQRVFVGLTGHEELPQLAVVASTLMIAALFAPLRRRIQAIIDRRFYRRKYDAAKMLSAFNARIRDETDLGTLSDDLVGVVKETMQPEHVTLWLRPDTGSKGRQPH